MNHVEAHNKLSTMIDKLEKGIVKPQFAKEVFNGYGKLLANCKNELNAINLGFPVDVPLLGIKSVDVKEIGGKGVKKLAKENGRKG
jgi:hypothetical protein